MNNTLDPDKPHGFYFQKALSEMSDEEVGREVRKIMKRLVDPTGNFSSHILLASRVLAACLATLTTEKGDNLEQVLKNQFLKGKPIGDFRITVERI